MRKPKDSGETWIIRGGDWAGSVAGEFGYRNWEQNVWKNSRNSELTRKRTDPHLLAPGDKLFIPAWEKKSESVPSDQRHRFTRDAGGDHFRMRLVGDGGKPLADEPYILEITQQSGTDLFRQRNKRTDADGVLEERIPLDAREGLLRLPGQNIEIQLLLGHLEPMDGVDDKTRTRAVQKRLLALGFNPGPIDGIAGPLTAAAVSAFQQFAKDNAGGDDSSIIDAGPVDGIIGPKTTKALRSFYGC